MMLSAGGAAPGKRMLLVVAALATALAASQDLVLSRYEHGSAGRRHHDTIRCHTAIAGHHGSLEALVEDFVLADTIWCVDPAPGSTCTDETSRTTYRLIAIDCHNDTRQCTAAIDCYELIFERFWVCLLLTLVATALLVGAVRLVEQRTEARRKVK
jgi:hypothetical protein